MFDAKSDLLSAETDMPVSCHIFTRSNIKGGCKRLVFTMELSHDINGASVRSRAVNLLAEAQLLCSV